MSLCQVRSVATAAFRRLVVPRRISRSIAAFSHISCRQQQSPPKDWRSHAAAWQLHDGITAVPTTRFRGSQHRELFSTDNNNVPSSYRSIRILYASQTGTAQLFAMQLSAAIEDHVEQLDDCTVQALSEVNPTELLLSSQQQQEQKSGVLYLFLVSTTGVGEFPDNGRDFYQQLQKAEAGVKTDTESSSSFLHYAMFALGNATAHPHHYCAAAKALDRSLHEKLSARAVLPLQLGDDGDQENLLEDTFDQWQENVIQFIINNGDNNKTGVSSVDAVDEEPTATSDTEQTEEQEEPELVATRPTLYPPLRLSSSSSSLSDSLQSDLLDTCPTFYKEGSQRMKVTYNQSLNPDPNTMAGLHEMHLELPKGVTYETGDHLMVYPRNSDMLVESYLELLEQGDDNDFSPQSIVEGPVGAGADQQQQRGRANYPHPTGISIEQTLTHCVDLEALPSPSFARWITGQGRDLDYRTAIAQPRRTVLDLWLEHSADTTTTSKITLQDLLYHLPPLQPRYYSIASSRVVHPTSVYLTYRPVHYLSRRGAYRHGLCTSYLQRQRAGTTVVAAINSNPTFRLPTAATAPIVLIAGGCGVAPIRAFLEELLATAALSPPNKNNQRRRRVHLFLGFRNPADQVYQELVQQTSQDLLLQTCRITFQSGCGSSRQCGLVSQALVQESEALLPLLLSNDDKDAAAAAHFYVCGGARAFGVAIERALHEILRMHASYQDDDEAANERLRELYRQGRLHEDLSD